MRQVDSPKVLDASRPGIPAAQRSRTQAICHPRPGRGLTVLPKRFRGNPATNKTARHFAAGFNLPQPSLAQLAVECENLNAKLTPRPILDWLVSS
jgi:hypothetical protein